MAYNMEMKMSEPTKVQITALEGFNRVAFHALRAPITDVERADLENISQQLRQLLAPKEPEKPPKKGRK